jgi:plasmid rolling circle replication initiator protein Rep
MSQCTTPQHNNKKQLILKGKIDSGSQVQQLIAVVPELRRIIKTENFEDSLHLYKVSN